MIPPTSRALPTRCDTCGAAADYTGCTVNPLHLVVLTQTRRPVTR